MSSPFPAPTFANQKISIAIPVPTDLTKFKVRLFIEGMAPATAVNDQFDIFDVQLNLDSTGYGTPQASRTVGLEPSRQFSGNLPAGVAACEYGAYLRAMTSGFSTTCPDGIKEGDMWPHAYWPTAAQAAYMPSSAMAYNVKVTYGGTSGLPGQIFFGSDQLENIMHVGDPAYLNWLHTVYLPLVMTSGNVPSTKTKFGWFLWTMDGFTPNFQALGTMVNGVFHHDVTPDTGFPQTVAEWNAGWARYFSYAKEVNSPVRFSPHIGSMQDWGQFQTIFADCPCMLREIFTLSETSAFGAQMYNELLALHWFANVAPPVFPNDPPTRIVDFGCIVDNGDIHSALALYCQMRGPNTFFGCLGPTGQDAMDPAKWLPTANKLGAATSAPTPIVGTGTATLLKRTHQGGISYFNFTGSSQTIVLPSGATDWVGTPLASITLPHAKGDVVLVGTPVSAPVRPTRTAVIMGPDGTVTNPALAIDNDSDPPVTASTITRTNFSVSTVGSVLELSGFGG